MIVQNIRTLTNSWTRDVSCHDLRLRFLVLPVGVRLEDTTSEAADREPLHYIPIHSANLRVKAKEN